MIYERTGLKTPDISILSDAFLAEVRDLLHRNLALKLLVKLLGNECRDCCVQFCLPLDGLD